MLKRQGDEVRYAAKRQVEFFVFMKSIKYVKE